MKEIIRRPKVSVIVAVYNVEPYVERCVHSLFNQTLDDIEYIIVDDCSPDNSIEIIKKTLDRYPQRKKQVKFIHHESNQGQAGARTSGMKAATGEYMIHCDPDDWVELNMYELLYNAAHPIGKNPIDVVLCNYMLHEMNGTKEVYIREFNTPQDYIKYVYKKHAPLFFLHTRLVSTELINKYCICPFSGINFGEDRNVSIRINHYAQSILVIPDHLYHYNKLNENAITRLSRNESLWESWKLNVDLISDFLLSSNKREYRKASNYFKFDAKMQFRNIFKNDREWFDLYRECHGDIILFEEYSIFSRVVLSVVLSNYLFFKLFSYVKRVIIRGAD